MAVSGSSGVGIGGGMSITIYRSTNGFVVQAGCMTLVFEDRAKLAVELTRWLERPEIVEAEYIKKYQTGPADVPASAMGIAPPTAPYPGAPYPGTPVNADMRERDPQRDRY